MSRYYQADNVDAPEDLDDYETRVRHAIARMWRDPNVHTDPRLANHLAGMFHCLSILTGRTQSELRAFFRLDTFGPETPPLEDALERMIQRLCDPKLTHDQKRLLVRELASEWAELRDLDDQGLLRGAHPVSAEEMAEQLAVECETAS